MHEVLLLRWCQAGIILCGILLILIGSGVQIRWLHAAVLVVASGVIAGLLYEGRRRLRGEGDGLVAMLLPLAGGLSGMFALLHA